MDASDQWPGIPIDELRLDTLIRLIYCTVDYSGAWPYFLKELAAAVDCPTAMIVQSIRGDWADIRTEIGLGEYARRNYEDHYVLLNPYRDLRVQYAHRLVVTGEDLLSTSDLVKTEFYNDYMHPNGFEHVVSILTDLQSSHFTCIDLLSEKCFIEKNLDLCRRLAPHLVLAAELHCRLAAVENHPPKIKVTEHELAKLGLTPAEAKLAYVLYNGQTVAGSTQSIGLSINAVQWYVSQILQKLGIAVQDSEAAALRFVMG